MAKMGKDSPQRFIDQALTGGSGPSNGIHDYKIDRPNQSIKTAVPMDNVGKHLLPIDSSILDTKFRGGPDNLGHSLKGATANDAEVGAAGPVRKTIFPDH